MTKYRLIYILSLGDDTMNEIQALTGVVIDVGHQALEFSNKWV